MAFCVFGDLLRTNCANKKEGRHPERARFHPCAEGFPVQTNAEGRIPSAVRPTLMENNQRYAVTSVSGLGPHHCVASIHP